MADTTRPTQAAQTPKATDWPAQVTDTVVGLVDNAKGKINGPATSGTRGVVYGTLASIVGTAVLVLALVLAFRLTDVFFQAVLGWTGLEHAGRSVWISHLVWAVGFSLGGAMLLRKGRRSAHVA